MNFLFRRAVRWVIFWGAGSGICLTVGGQTIPAPRVPTPGMITMTVASNLPPFPVYQPRTEFFRKVLAMKAAEQEAWLTNRPPQVRAQLAAKIREYQAMAPDAREAVLRATELHEYLEYFIKAPAAGRASQLAQVPLEYRATIQEKLREFDLLPPELQQEVLAGKTTANYFLNPRPLLARTVRRPNPLLPPPPMPPAPLSYLSRLPADQRREMYASFQHFFDLDDDARQKILSTLPLAERGLVAKTLRDLERMPQEQRDRGLQSITMLADMSDEQRQTFFRNAELWQQLPPSERQTWRKVVVHLPPMPPDPASFEGPALVTNGAN
jgi:hypothetical protein